MNEHIDPAALDVLATQDSFITSIRWDEYRRVLVFRRRHGARDYVRLRTWNRHRSRRVWYPTTRFFVVPLANASALAESLLAANDGTPLTRKPSWYAARERAAMERLEELEFAPISDRALKQKRKATLDFR